MMLRRFAVVLGVLAIAVSARGDGSATLSQTAVDALTAIDQSPTSAELTNVLAQPAFDSLVTIALGAPTIDPGVQLRAIQGLTQYTDPTSKTAAEIAMQNMLDPKQNRYATATAGTDVLILRAAISALAIVGQDGSPDDVGIIANFLNHGSRDVRTSAARGLRDLGNSNAITPLRIRYGQESVEQVRLAISEALRVLPQL